VAAGAVVTRDVRPNELVAGNPARTLGWVDVNGEVVSRDAERPASLPFGGIDQQEELS
jgi:serine acetyltransferase